MKNPSIKKMYIKYFRGKEKSIFCIKTLSVIANVSGFLQLYGQEVPPFFSFHFIYSLSCFRTHV